MQVLQMLAIPGIILDSTDHYHNLSWEEGKKQATRQGPV
jgi:hypothetical protein